MGQAHGILSRGPCDAVATNTTIHGSSVKPVVFLLVAAPRDFGLELIRNGLAGDGNATGIPQQMDCISALHRVLVLAVLECTPGEFRPVPVGSDDRFRPAVFCTCGTHA